MLFKHAVKASERAGNREAATGIALASALSGVAYGNVPFGAAHALCEAIRDTAGISDEEAMTLSLLACMKNASEEAKRKAETLIEKLTIAKNEENSEENSENAPKTAMEKLAEWMMLLCESSGLVCKISETSIPRETFGDIAEAAQNRRAAVTAKGSIAKEQFLAILNDAY